MSGAFFSGLALSLLLGGAPAELRAQEPPDTTRQEPPDTLGPGPRAMPAVQDTMAADTAARDTTPPPQLPAYPAAGGTGWDRGVWEWERADLLRSGALTLLDLIERVPGLDGVRSAIYGQAEALFAPAGMPGRVEIRLDGFTLDNLRGPGYELSDFEINQLERVRLERWGDGVRIHLVSVAPRSADSETLIEAATGDQGVNLFRGSVRLPRILGGPLAAAFERLDADGLGPAGAASRTAFWGKWSLVSDGAGLQLEFRNTGIERAGVQGGAIGRSDWVARARSRLPLSATGELFVGASAVDDSLAAAAGDPVLTRRSGLQAGARAALDTGAIHVDASVRFRTLDGLPGTTAETNGDLSLPLVSLGGFARWEDWGATSATSWGGRATAGPVLGLRAFVQATGGSVGIPFAPDPVFHESRTLRLGGELSRWGFRIGAARISVASDSVPALGLPFETGTGPFPGMDNDLLEASVRIPTGLDPLWLEGTYLKAVDSVATPYSPEEAWRGAIVYHHVPLESGNLEVQARLEHWRRGAFLLPTESGLVSVPRMGQYDFYLHIRVVRVRAFLRWENFTLRRDYYDVPGHVFPPQRVYYGVKWTFFQ